MPGLVVEEEVVVVGGKFSTSDIVELSEIHQNSRKWIYKSRQFCHT